MKLFKRILCSVLLVALILTMLALSACSKTEDDGEFVPVLRFAITSDVHVRSTSNDYGSRQRLDRFLGSAYEYAKGEDYSSLDGIFIVGDLTQDGKTQEYDIALEVINTISDESTVVRVVMGNHEMHAYGKGDARFTPENIEKSTQRYMDKMGYESEDSHIVINGYHFISIANDSYETRNFFDDESLAWLKGEIEAAMADDPTSDKPIFVMQHQPPRSEVRGFTAGDIELGELLKDYPRVIDFSGHTHRSILDPQSIWQDGFTAIGTGGLAYLGYNMAGHPTLDNSAVVAIDDEGGWVDGGSTGARTGAMYYIVEVDAKNNVRLKIYDLLTESFYGEPITFKVGENEPEVFTPDRAERSLAPTFAPDAKVEVVSDDYNYSVISFSTPVGGDLPQYYRIELWANGASEPSVVVYRLAGMENAVNMPKTATAPLRGYRESGEYAIKIYAVNCWGKESAHITGAITIGEATLEPDILDVEFNADGSATNGGSLLPVSGTVNVSYDEELGKNVASFDGSSGYRFSGIKDYYDRITYGVTMEAYFKIDEGADTTMSILSNTQSSGLGLAWIKDGSVRFNFGVNNGVRRYLAVNTAAGTVSAGEWTHVVATFDGKCIKLYVNGEQMTLYDNEGAEIGSKLNAPGVLFEAPTGLAATLIVGGDISSSGGIETGFIGDIAVASVFSRALTEDEVDALYSRIIE